MSVRVVAREHYRRRVRLVQAVEAEARRLWALVSLADIARSWLALLPRMVLAVTAAQRAAAGSADGYLDAVLVAQQLDTTPVARVVAGALVGVASDGRNLADLLTQPAFTSLVALGSKVPTDRAMASGLASLQMIAGTQVADAGRVADGVALVARPSVSGYVRMLNPPSCARCVVLAGKRYRWNAGFQRHPRCDCVHIPVAEDLAEELRTHPATYFGSLSHDEQDAAFGKAGAQSIRDGADIGQVVNARRGMYIAGLGSVRFKATTEGTTARGFFGGYEVDSATGQLRRRGIREPLRLMPEQIYREAAGDRDEALRLLRRFGYII